VDDIKKIKAHVGDRIRIKASGGIKTRAFAEDLIASGADRLGTSSGILIMENKISGSDN
jgi:deoxyribose-phosphate aldolase